VNRDESCLRLIQSDRQFCFWEATKLEMRVGTRKISQLQTKDLQNTLKGFRTIRRMRQMITLEERMARLTPERKAKIVARTNDLHREYLALQMLRQKLNLTQAEMAKKLGVKQPAISKLENGDRRLTLKALSEIITALGGEWEINVKLPGLEVMRLTGSEEFPH
jgi:DNA-binding XRE family transcriptional regulator